MVAPLHAVTTLLLTLGREHFRRTHASVDGGLRLERVHRAADAQDGLPSHGARPARHRPAGPRLALQRQAHGRPGPRRAARQGPGAGSPQREPNPILP